MRQGGQSQTIFLDDSTFSTQRLWQYDLYRGYLLVLDSSHVSRYLVLGLARSFGYAGKCCPTTPFGNIWDLYTRRDSAISTLLAGTSSER